MKMRELRFTERHAPLAGAWAKAKQLAACPAEGRFMPSRINYVITAHRLQSLADYHKCFRALVKYICAPNVSRRTQNINLRNTMYFCANINKNLRTQMFVRALTKKSARHNIYTRTSNLFLRPTNFIMGTSIVAAHIKGSITNVSGGSKNVSGIFP